MDRTACREEDPDLFSDKTKVHEARLVCVVRCPVRKECLASVKEVEHGRGRDSRDGVVAGLVHNERYRLDPHVPRGEDDSPLLELDGTERCGTYNALLGHLWRGERIDAECWSAQARRERLAVAATAAKRQASTSAPAAPAAPHAPAVLPAEPGTKVITLKERHVYRLWACGLPDLKIARRADLSTPAVRRIREGLRLPPNAQERKGP
ncbi:WhiB family transcriptional regulator [Streptomyces sp. STR69]|uniref:WhiB family transcriptional regulator n=1 Tax=Streptomyces sp. STR69 TaxID=1796942 RepID=UPI0021C56826|nr:WhiB family transcriptional regulator [Streptomyces sp. STR69]